ncbi:MAG TPA: M20/M25/M40 family metallo-hydrolase [Armatimonadota bacterium]|jgi:tripeptide aminopeptidase
MINQQRLVDTFLELVHLNSPSLHEKAAMDAVQARLERLGFTVQRDDAGEKMGGDTGNIIARRAGTTGAPPVFFNAHIDTVQPTAGIVVVQEDGIIKTDGTTILGADDKAGVACILEALESAAEDNAPSAPTEVIITICEEIGLHGSRLLDPARVTARSGWVVDSGQPLSAIITRAPSQDQIHATIHGKAAHAGARPEEGINAITVAATAIAAMPQGRLDTETTANVGVITGGQATNIVPPLCHFDAEARSHSTEKLAAQTAAMVKAVEDAAAKFGARAEINVERIFNAFQLPEDSHEVKVAAAAMRTLGLEPEIHSTGGGMDANYFHEKGMKCTVIGCGYGDIHTVDEYIPVADFVIGARVVEAIMREATKG